MCYSVAFLENKLSKLIARYKHVLPPDWKDEPLQTASDDSLPVHYFISGFAHPLLPVINKEGLQTFYWGLIPFWVKDEATAIKLRKGTLNAVGETVFEKPSFRSSIGTNRCLLPVSGFFEWREYRGTKYPYFIQLRGDAPFSLGCLHDSWTNRQTGEVLNTFSIITTPANSLMTLIHNRKKRMPLILDKDAERQWLDTSLNATQIRAIIKPLPSEKLKAFTVSRMLNYARNHRDVPEAVEPFEYPELPQLPGF